MVVRTLRSYMSLLVHTDCLSISENSSFTVKSSQVRFSLFLFSLLEQENYDA